MCPQRRFDVRNRTGILTPLALVRPLVRSHRQGPRPQTVQAPSKWQSRLLVELRTAPNRCTVRHSNRPPFLFHRGFLPSKDRRTLHLAEPPYRYLRKSPRRHVVRTKLSRQHEIDCNSGCKRHHATALNQGLESPFENRGGSGSRQHRIAANDGELLHLSILTHRGIQDDQALNALLSCRLWIHRLDPLE